MFYPVKAVPDVLVEALNVVVPVVLGVFLLGGVRCALVGVAIRVVVLSMVIFIVVGVEQARRVRRVDNNHVSVVGGAQQRVDKWVIPTAVLDDKRRLRQRELVLGGGLVAVRVLRGAIDEARDGDEVATDLRGDVAVHIGRGHHRDGAVRVLGLRGVGGAPGEGKREGSRPGNDQGEGFVRAHTELSKVYREP